MDNRRGLTNPFTTNVSWKSESAFPGKSENAIVSFPVSEIAEWKEYRLWCALHRCEFILLLESLLVFVDPLLKMSNALYCNQGP